MTSRADQLFGDFPMRCNASSFAKILGLTQQATTNIIKKLPRRFYSKPGRSYVLECRQILQYYNEQGTLMDYPNFNLGIQAAADKLLQNATKQVESAVFRKKIKQNEGIDDVSLLSSNKTDENDEHKKYEEEMKAMKAATVKLKLAKEKMQYDKEMGKLVNKEVVFKQLFQFGLEVRTKIEAIPNLIIDEMMATKDRNEKKLILEKAINEALMHLSETDKIKF